MQVRDNQVLSYPSTSEQSTSSKISSSFHGTETDLDVLLPTDAMSPYEQRLQGVENTIDRLYRLSQMIRRPSMASQNSKAEQFPITDDQGNNIDREFFDYASRLVKHQFPEASDVLHVRLAMGIVIRRKRFAYRKSHQQKLGSKTVTIQKQEQMGLDKAGSDRDTVRGERVPAIDTSLVIENHDTERPSRMAPSQTSASKVTMSPITMDRIMEDEESRLSTTFTDTLPKGTPMILPDPPRPPKGSKEFECPYCTIVLPINRAKASGWR